MCCTKATLRAPAGRDVGVRLQCYYQPSPTDVEAGVPWEHARQSLRGQAPSRPLAHMQANSTPPSKKPARRQGEMSGGAGGWCSGIPDNSLPQARSAKETVCKSSTVARIAARCWPCTSICHCRKSKTVRLACARCATRAGRGQDALAARRSRATKHLIGRPVALSKNRRCSMVGTTAQAPERQGPETRTRTAAQAAEEYVN
jgi:hypothetical protein